MSYRANGVQFASDSVGILISYLSKARSMKSASDMAWFPVPRIVFRHTPHSSYVTTVGNCRMCAVGALRNYPAATALARAHVV